MSDILFLAHRVPYPPNRGDKIRSWHLLKGIAKLAPVHVCALWDDEGDLAHIDVLKSVAKTVHLERADPSRLKAMARALRTGGSASVAACESAALQTAINAVLQRHSVSTIFAFSGQMAQFVPEGRHRFVMDFVDMDSAKFAAFGGFANRQEAKRLFAFEKATAQRADLSLFVSDAEASLFRRETGLDADKVSFIDNGIDLDRYDPALPFDNVPAEERPLIIFTGQMDYRPNIDAVTSFARETMPMIRARSGGARFAIVGRAPTAEVTELATLPGVSVTGEVADTRDWLAAADLVVAPLKLARGIQNKVLEAMAMAKPVIASPAAAEGIHAVAGEELVIADGAAAEAEAVCTLLANPAQAAEIGSAARARMIGHYSWEARLAGLPAILGLAS